MGINPKDPEDSAGRIYSWLVASGARFIEEREHYYQPLKETIVYQLWQTVEGEFVIREATYPADGAKPTESEACAESVEDFRQYVQSDIEYYRWLASPEGQAEAVSFH
jgi:hypothetical protein